MHSFPDLLIKQFIWRKKETNKQNQNHLLCNDFAAALTTSKILNKMRCQPPEALKSSEEMQINECNLACVTPNP